MKATEIKNKSWFSALIDKNHVIGRVYVHKNDVFLCQDYCDGCDSPDKLGFRFSWVVRGVGVAKALIFEKESVTEFKLHTRKPALDLTKVNIICGYHVEKTGNKLKFGCGAVTLPISEIKSFLKIRNILEERNITLSEIDLKVLENKINYGTRV